MRALNYDFFYLPLVTCFIFLAAGTAFLIRARMLLRNKERTGFPAGLDQPTLRSARAPFRDHAAKNRIRHVTYCILGIGFIVAGMATSVWVLLGPWPEERERVVRSILEVKPSELVSIEITPHPNPGYRSLVKAPIILANPEDLRQVCAALVKAQPFSPNHPSGAYCLLRMKTARDVRSCEVADTSNNGVLVTITSADGYTGWVLGNYRCDPLGAVLRAVIAQSIETKPASTVTSP